MAAVAQPLMVVCEVEAVGAFRCPCLPVSVQPLAQASTEKMLNERAGCMFATPFAFLFNDTNHSLGRKGWAHLISSFAMSSNALA